MHLKKIVGVSVIALVCGAAPALAQDVDVMQYADGNGDGTLDAPELNGSMKGG